MVEQWCFFTINTCDSPTPAPDYYAWQVQTRKEYPFTGNLIFDISLSAAYPTSQSIPGSRLGGKVEIHSLYP